MNAFPTLPATQLGVAVGLIYRIVAFLALGIRACGLGTISAVTPQLRAQLIAPAARLLALARDVRPACGASAAEDATAPHITQSHAREAR